MAIMKFQKLNHNASLQQPKLNWKINTASKFHPPSPVSAHRKFSHPPYVERATSPTDNPPPSLRVFLQPPVMNTISPLLPSTTFSVMSSPSSSSRRIYIHARSRLPFSAARACTQDAISMSAARLKRVCHLSRERRNHSIDSRGSVHMGVDVCGWRAMGDIFVGGSGCKRVVCWYERRRERLVHMDVCENVFVVKCWDYVGIRSEIRI